MSATQFNSKLSPKHRFVWLVPVLWMGGVALGYKHPGDEYGLWVISALPGMWIGWVLGSVGDIGSFLPKLLLAGGLVMGGLGWLMDRLRVPFLAWCLGVGLGTVGIALQALSHYPTWEKAMSKNGSLTAYVCFGWNLSIALATILGLLLTAALRRWWLRPVKPPSAAILTSDPDSGNPSDTSGFSG
jgi:hypothetical protein